MESHSFAGWFALITGVVVLVSAVLQVRDGELTRDEARGQFVFAAGMMVAGIGIGFVDPPTGPRVALVGIVGLAAGLLIQERHHEPH